MSTHLVFYITITFACVLSDDVEEYNFILKKTGRRSKRRPVQFNPHNSCEFFDYRLF